MLLIIGKILTCVSVVIQISFANYCSSSISLYQAYNLGANVFVGQGSTLWKFDPKTIRTDDTLFNAKNIFGKSSFDWVDTAFTFNLDECDSTLETAQYCDAVNRAKDVVFAIGKRVEAVNDSRKYGYLTFRVTGDDQLYRLDDSDVDLIWGLRSKGSLLGNFWVPLTGDVYYESSVFVRSRNELFVTVFDTSSFSDSGYHLMSHKLPKDGNWTNGWVEVAKIGFRGMFDINGRVFGFNKENNVLEFKWNEDNDGITFEPISNMKELLNCFGNSSLVETKTNFTDTSASTLSTSSSSITTTTTPITTTTTTISTTTPATTSEVNTKTTVSDQTSSEDSELDLKLKDILNSSEVEVQITTTTENSSLSKQMNRTSGEEPYEEDDWTVIYVLAIVLIIIVTIVAVIFIIRQKSNSQIMYLNSRDKDQMSCEIPLNNNHPKEF